MEHTPEPWNIQATDENDLAWKISYDTEDGLTYPIADIISYPEATANAKLIASAPDMENFIIQYLYSEHGICDPNDEAAPYTPEELKDMAIRILAER